MSGQQRLHVFSHLILILLNHQDSSPKKNIEIPNHRRFLNINGRILTDDAVYQEILNNKEDKKDIQYSSLSDPFESYKAKIIRITEKIKEDICVFSTYPADIIIHNNFPLLITF